MVGEFMGKCVVCGKKAEKGITKNGKFFCCADCLKQFVDPKKPDTKGNVCEFC